MNFPPRIENRAMADMAGAFAAFRPPKRVSVSQGAHESLFLRQPGGYVGPWAPDETPYMVEPMNMLASKRHEAVAFVGPARTGKALDVGTPIPTPDGWTTMGALTVGDEIIAPSGNPTKVVFVTGYQHDRPCYLVEFSDGETVVADADHRWGVERFYWKAPNWRYEIRTTTELLADLHYGVKANGRARFRYHIRNTAPIELPERQLRLDPYLFGVWLGDGSKAQATLSCHADDATHYIPLFEAQGFKASPRKDKGNTLFIHFDRREILTTQCQRGHVFAEVGQAKNKACMECLRQGHHRRKYGKQMAPLGMFNDTFQSRLTDIGVLNNKHIPQDYLRSSVEQRWQLLRGLMDTDGCSSQEAASAEFTTTLPALRDGFCELARSLGLKPKTAVKATTWEYKGESKTGTAFRITFPIPVGVEIFSLPRKVEKTQHAKVDVSFRAIVGITPVESRPVKCIQVADESHMFLAGRAMIPTHNTLGLLDGWFARNVVCDPGDMLILQMTQDKAREYSKTRIDRAIVHSPQVAELMSKSGHNDNTHDKLFKHGMFVKIGWPTATQLSGSDYRYVALTDYDRMPDDVDGEGAPYGLALKRTQTFMSRGMCMVESSPGRPIVDPTWKPTTPHEGPPCTGVVGIYNRSDRRRWYWPCPDCGEHFEAKPGLELFGLPDEDNLIEIIREADIDELAGKYNRIICPHCGTLLEQKHKHPMNRRGRWVGDGQYITPDGEVCGTPMKSTIAGFWLGGVAAAYQNWHSLVVRYLQGLRDYVLTGSELALQNTVNTDQGMPYLSRLLAQSAKGASGPESRKNGGLQRFIAPDETRFVVAAVDVQGGQNARFVVQVHAIGPHLEQWPLDRFAITESTRTGVDGGYAPIDPASYPEDWDMLNKLVLDATYRTSVEGREIKIKAMAIDTGGEDGVTGNAYQWYRRLRAENKHYGVMLVKGASTPTAPLVKESWVGTKRHGEKGDIPLYLLNSNMFKDMVSSALKRTLPGPTYMHMPGWLPRSFYDELNAEVRDAKGRWVKIKKRNEAFDLCAYIRALCVRLGADKPAFWENPPHWALPLAENSGIIMREDRQKMQDGGTANGQTANLRRRSTKSSYLK
ncbi:MAG: phage terminase large subunit family protein [Acidobacteria bacterium]|nr:phage terminase large subunit family protein [Acidobacteriota bacterium]